MEAARQKVREALVRSASPAVLSSFGKDSMLLLWLVREVKPSTPVIWFRTGQDERFAKRIIREWNLTAFSWAPADMYVVKDADEARTLVHEYGIGACRFPVLIDLNGDGGPCAVDKFPLRVPSLYLPFDILLVGYKDTDQHWLKGDSKLFKDGTFFDRAEVIAPLRHMTDEAVRAAIVDHHIPFEPTPDELTLCTHCVSTMPLQEFRSRFSLTEVIENGSGIRG